MIDKLIGIMGLEWYDSDYSPEAREVHKDDLTVDMLIKMCEYDDRIGIKYKDYTDYVIIYLK